jgi:hypothetical protein
LIEIDNIDIYNAIYNTDATKLRNDIIIALNNLADMMLKLNTLSSKLKTYRGNAIKRMEFLKDVRKHNKARVNEYIDKVNRLRQSEPTTTPGQIKEKIKADPEDNEITLPNDGGSGNNLVEKRGEEDSVPDEELSTVERDIREFVRERRQTTGKEPQAAGKAPPAADALVGNLLAQWAAEAAKEQ